VLLPCPLEPAWAADFDLSKWFACVVFPRYFLNPFYTMFEDLTFPSTIPSVIVSALFQILLVHEFLGLTYFNSEKGLPSLVLSY